MVNFFCVCVHLFLLLKKKKKETYLDSFYINHLDQHLRSTWARDTSPKK